jgi:hypothetical protein
VTGPLAFLVFSPPGSLCSFGFIIFLAFQSYDDARIGAETEATIVAQQIQTAQFLPPDTAKELTGELVCYGRSVAGAEWDAINAGTLGRR